MLIIKFPSGTDEEGRYFVQDLRNTSRFLYDRFEFPHSVDPVVLFFLSPSFFYISAHVRVFLVLCIS